MPKRVFLDWKSPLLPAIADRLMPACGAGPLHLGEYLILTPTRQAGRRLREYLATSWRNRGGTAVLSMEVHPPSFILQPDDSQEIAHAFDWMSAWQKTLIGIDPGTLPSLLPQQKEAFSAPVALEFGQRLQRLREELLDAGLDLSAVAESPLLQSEKDRWQDLARLEETYRKHLENMGRIDPTDAKRETLKSYQPPEGIRKIILAGVPDPSPLLLHRLEQLDTDAHNEIEVWIHAPEKEAEAFDSWGKPNETWQTRFLGRGAEPEGWIECLADPPALCNRMQEFMQEIPESPDLAFGLLDDALVLPLQHALAESGQLLYHPKPAKLAESAPVRLLERFQEQRRRQDPVSLRELWRQSDLLNALSPENGRSLLKIWEEYAGKHFPENADNVSATIPEGPLKEAWEKMWKWIRVEDPKGILQMLEEIYADRKLDPNHPEQRYQVRQFHQLAETLQEAARRQNAGDSPSSGILLQVLKSETVDPPRVEGTLTAEGWLELAYHPAPHLLLTGFQEGNVPAVNAPDPFLPNQLREELGLRSDRDWLARDAYLFHCMIMSRAPGAVRVWVLKRDRDGSPLLPSRLLFACDDERMLARAELLFHEPTPPPLQPAPAPGLLFQPDQRRDRHVQRLSVSAVNQYLQCPSRFYFRYILGLDRRDDVETEPDAACFGTLLHAVLEKVVLRKPPTVNAWNQAVEEVLDKKLRDTFGDTLRMSLQVFRHSALARLRAAGPIQRKLWEEGWQVIATECKLERECRGMSIVGKIDRVDFHPDLGFRIIDYKSSDQPEPPEKIHVGTAREDRESIQFEYKNKTRQWTNLQLPLYRWLARTEKRIDPNLPLAVYYFNLPKSVQNSRLEAWPEEEALAGEAEKCLEAIVELIQARQWLPTSKPTRYDDYQPLLHHGSDWIPAPA